MDNETKGLLRELTLQVRRVAHAIEFTAINAGVAATRLSADDCGRCGSLYVFKESMKCSACGARLMPRAEGGLYGEPSGSNAE